jgi:hypothetical protein
LKHITPHSLPPSKNIAVSKFHEGFENSHLGHNIYAAIDQGQTIPSKDAEARARSGDDLGGTFFLLGLEMNMPHFYYP